MSAATITKRQRQVLDALDTLGRPLPVAEVSEGCGLPRTTTRSTLIGLERRGLVHMAGVTPRGGSMWVLLNADTEGTP